MNEFTLRKPPKNHDSVCGDLMTMAEKELAAFFSAVAERFGSKQARISAEEWLQELMNIQTLPDTAREWRLLTVNALARLTSRLQAHSASIAS